MAARRWTDVHTAQLRGLNGQGISLTEAAKIMGFAKATVSRRSTIEHIEWDRTRTVVATTAKVADADARIAALLEGEIDIAEFEQATTLDHYRHGAKWRTFLRETGGGEREVLLDFIPSRDRRENTNSRSGSAAIITRYRDALASKSSDLPAVDQWLEFMTGGGDDGGEPAHGESPDGTAA